MREHLKRLMNDPPQVYHATVGWRSRNVRLAGKVALQKLLKNIMLGDQEVADHLILTVGKEIPSVPILYSRIIPGNKISFLAVPIKYERADGTEDYALKMLKLLSSDSGGE